MNDAASVSPVCSTWIATHDPVQVSNIASIVDVETAIATPSGVLVGYADIQFPPVDSNWHGREVAFGDGALGSDQTYWQRSGSLGWGPISFAQGAVGNAAAASDQDTGLLFTTTDARGAPHGPVVRSPGNSARDLFATANGFSMLRSPWDASGLSPGPVTLDALDPSGNVTLAVTLLTTAVPIFDFSRVGFADHSFLLVWVGSQSGCPACRSVGAQHFTGDGTALAPPVLLHSFDADSLDLYAIAGSSSGVLLVWSERALSGAVTLVAEPFNVDGVSMGSPQTFAHVAGENAPTMTLATAPGGDLIVAWVDGVDGNGGGVNVAAVSAAGALEGPVSMLQTITPFSDGSVRVAASSQGAVVVYDNSVSEGIEVFAIPMQCAR